MYLSIIGKPTDEDLVKYPSIHLTSFHEWDPSVLDYSHPEGDGEPLWAYDPQHIDLIDPNFDNHGLYTERAINTLSSLADVQHNLPCPYLHPSPSFRPTSIMSSQKHLIMTNTDLILVGLTQILSGTPLRTLCNGEFLLAPTP